MSENSAIEWTDSTFNPWIGCTKVGPGCDHCYAEALMDKRMGKAKWGAGNPRIRTSAAYWRQPLKWNERNFYECQTCGWRGDTAEMDRPNGKAGGGCTRCEPGFGDVRLSRRRVFCASLADVFDNEVNPDWRSHLLALILATPNLDWLLLTKRIGNVATMLPGWYRNNWPAHVWIGATVVNQEEVDRDIPKLLAVPARVRFLSVEPMLGPLSFEGMFANPNDCRDGTNALEVLDWVICGGESGSHARPMHPDWARSLRDQCQAVGAPFLFKQWGEWRPPEPEEEPLSTASSAYSGTTAKPMIRVGKKGAGRALDGREWNQFPQPCAP